MKKLFLLVLAIALFSACQKNEPQRYYSSSPEIDTVKALISDYHDGDWESWEGHYADTAKIYQNTLIGVSPRETMESLKSILANVSSYKFDDKDLWYEMIIDDDKEKWVNFWGNWRGTVAANGQELIIPVHLTLQFVNGKIVEEYGYYNLAEITAVLSEIEASKIAGEETTK
ncbi:MAG: nuclear transport factor 2 family protein [Flavobacteriaceae bacterium]|nr:nuclear transport factor 2 family protein [Flavobacteriaceae bacterium]